MRTHPCPPVHVLGFPRYLTIESINLLDISPVCLISEWLSRFLSWFQILPWKLSWMWRLYFCSLTILTPVIQTYIWKSVGGNVWQFSLCYAECSCRCWNAQTTPTMWGLRSNFPPELRILCTTQGRRNTSEHCAWRRVSSEMMPSKRKSV